MKQHIVDICLITLASITYVFSYFFRGSIAPITDVFEKEFNATSSQIGFMSSAFWLSYFVMQIPSGIMVQYLTSEFILTVSLFVFAILSLIFGLPLNSDQVAIPTVLFIICGIFVAPMLLCVMSMIGNRMGSNHVPFIGGINFFSASFFLFGANWFQAFLYQKYALWRPIYLVLGVIILIVAILFCTMNRIDYRLRSTPPIQAGSVRTRNRDLVQSNSIDTEGVDRAVDIKNSKNRNINESKDDQHQSSNLCTVLCGVQIRRDHSGELKERFVFVGESEHEHFGSGIMKQWLGS